MAALVTQFEVCMELGQQAHIEGNYRNALEHRLDAFKATPPEAYDRGRAARDIGASFDRLGDIPPGDTPEITSQVLSEAYFEYAYRQHRELMVDNDEAAREFTVSAMYMAVPHARRDEGKKAVDYIWEGWRVSQKLLVKNHGVPHQYDVNLVGRVAGILGHFGEKPPTDSTKGIGELTKSLAKDAGTDRILGTDPKASEEEIRVMQKKASDRARAARFIIGMNSLPTRNITQPLSSLILKKVVL